MLCIFCFLRNIFFQSNWFYLLFRHLWAKCFTFYIAFRLFRFLFVYLFVCLRFNVLYVWKVSLIIYLWILSRKSEFLANFYLFYWIFWSKLNRILVFHFRRIVPFLDSAGNCLSRSTCRTKKSLRSWHFLFLPYYLPLK